MNDKVLFRLQTLCSRREYCSFDIRRKALTLLEGDEQEASEILESLISDKYVDDLRYATAFARDKVLLTGWGPSKVSYQLRAKGIDRAAIDKALAEVDPDKSGENLLKVLRTKYAAIKDDPDWRPKLIRFAMGRGFDYESISNLLSEL